MAVVEAGSIPGVPGGLRTALSVVPDWALASTQVLDPEIVHKGSSVVCLPYEPGRSRADYWVLRAFCQRICAKFESLPRRKGSQIHE